MKNNTKDSKQMLFEMMQKVNPDANYGKQIDDIMNSQSKPYIKKFNSVDDAEDYLVNTMTARDEGNSDLGFVRHYVGRNENGISALVYEDGTVEIFKTLGLCTDRRKEINFKSIV